MKTNITNHYWVVMPVMRNFVMRAEKNESMVASICKAVNINPADLNNIDMKVSLESNIGIMETLLHISGDCKRQHKVD